MQQRHGDRDPGDRPRGVAASDPRRGTLAGSIVWGLALLVFAAIVPLVIVRAIVAPSGLAATLRDASTTQLWGTPPMAAFTIAVGLVRIAAPHGGGEFAIGLAQGLFVAGVVLSLLTAFVVPFLMMTQHELEPQSALAHMAPSRRSVDRRLRTGGVVAADVCRRVPIEHPRDRIRDARPWRRARRAADRRVL